jgi:serine/threonine protein phosphatase PrpC
VSAAPEHPYLVAVADGLGGEPAGDVASELAVTELAAQQRTFVDEERLQRGLHDVHQTLVSHSGQQPGRRGMATTVAAVVITSTEILVTNVGDSRVYEQSGEFLRLQSLDHRPFSAPGDAASNIVTQVLGGAGQPPTPHVHAMPLRTSRFLVCTDGLTDVVTEDELEGCLDGDGTVTVGGLLSAAEERGRYDDVSIAVVQVRVKKGAV